MSLQIINAVPCFRVFRRKRDNLIIIWNLKGLLEEHLKYVKVFRINPQTSQKIPLSFSTFIPKHENKFPGEIAGIIINHAANNLDPKSSYLIEIVLGEQNPISKILTVNPVEKKQSEEQPPARLILCAYDQETQKYLPLHGVWKGDKFVLLTHVITCDSTTN